MGGPQLLMSAAQIGQALAVGSSSPGQLLLTAAVRGPDVLQSGLQECPEGCGCRLRAGACRKLLERMGRGWGWGQG